MLYFPLIVAATGCGRIAAASRLYIKLNICQIIITRLRITKNLISPAGLDDEKGIRRKQMIANTFTTMYNAVSKRAFLRNGG